MKKSHLVAHETEAWWVLLMKIISFFLFYVKKIHLHFMVYICSILYKINQPPRYAFLTSSLAASSLASPLRVMRPVSST